MNYQKIEPPNAHIPIHVFGDVIENALEQAINISHRALHVAMMADHHLGYSMPIGGVAAYDGMVSPSGVGFDIACGNKAICLDVPADHVRYNIGKIMDRIFNEISFGMGRTNQEKIDDKYLQRLDPTKYHAWHQGYVNGLRDLAVSQLGTVGGGNHFVDILFDEEDRVWIANYFGSRGLGHKMAKDILNKAGAVDSINADATLLSDKSDLGMMYLDRMHLAGAYAYAGRDWVCDKVHSIIGGEIIDEVHNHHNFAWKENHNIDEDDRDVWVVRKGATPAFPGQRGFIGGSMASNSYIVHGNSNAGLKADDPRLIASYASLFSTVHGAGRQLSRSQAKGKFKNGEWKREPMVDRRAWRDMMHSAGVVLRGADLDESPYCYKDVDEVIAAQGDTIVVEHVLRPIGVAMAGPGVVDPYKD